MLFGIMAIIGLAGCASTPSSSTVPSAPPSATASAIASPGATLSATPTPSPTPAPPLTFVATGSMHTARGGATATLLKNGKVLIAGGYAHTDLPWTFYASAEIYDPETGKFANTGSMTAARAYVTAILLSDGRVLVAGGEGCSDPKHCTNIQSGAMQYLVSADIYDPATGKFTRTGSMTDITQSVAAALLPDGKVLVVGQANFAGQLYDPATGKFVPTGKVAGFTVPITATLLPNGKVLVTGDGVAQLYDEATGKFTTISLALPSATPTANYQGAVMPRTAPYTATLLPDGRVLLFEGGYLETYDPATGNCADLGFVSPGGGWIYPTATLLPDGRVLFEGGWLVPDPVTGDSTSTNIGMLYDPSGGQVSTGSMTTAVWARLPRCCRTAAS
jgi:WD40 repeat protein